MQRALAFLTILLAAGCIDPVSLKVDGGGVLVVDGWITDQPGPYSIKLSRSIRYDNSQPLKVYTIPEKGAKVAVIDHKGNVENLVEIASGTYRTGAIRGVVGGTYQLTIETAAGVKYRSVPEEIKPVPPITEIQYEFHVYEYLFSNAVGDARVQPTEGFEIFVNGLDPAGEANFYRWQVDGIFEFFSDTMVPEIQHCWAPAFRVESQLALASDLYFDGKPYRRYVAMVPYDRPTLYLVKLRQQSLTARAFEFWERIGDQQTSTGTLFDPPPTPIAGNIYNEGNADEVVLGYFWAASVTQSQLLINRFAASHFLKPSRNIPMRGGDCRTHETNATNVKPEGFPN